MNNDIMLPQSHDKYTLDDTLWQYTTHLGTNCSYNYMQPGKFLPLYRQLLNAMCFILIIFYA